MPKGNRTKCTLPPKKLDFTSTEEDKTEPYIYVYRNPLEKEIQEIKEFLSLKRELKVKEQGTLSEMTKDICLWKMPQIC